MDFRTPDKSHPVMTTYLLGSVDLGDVLAAQRRLVYELEESGEIALILSEHSPALTIGRCGSLAHLAPLDDDFSTPIPIPRFVSRGGGCWLHTSGQLAGYLIGHLGHLGHSTELFFLRLETALQSALADFDVNTHAQPDHSGLYHGNKRVVALGVSVLRNMVHYGFLINVGPHMRPFDVLDEPGLDHRSLRQTSMEAIRLRPVPPARLRARLVEEIRTVFDLETGPVFLDVNGIPPLPEVAKSHVCK